jgi:hypothetical protein
MRPVLDFGTVGPGKGKGDRILILPPGDDGPVPDGYLVARPKTNQIFSITRLSVKEGMTETDALALFKKIETYRLADAASGHLINRSPWPGSSTGTRSNRSGDLSAYRTAAFIVAGMVGLPSIVALWRH